MKSEVLPDSSELDADKFAAVVGGHWDFRPPDTWRYAGLFWHWDAYAPGKIVVARGDGFRYGVNLSALKNGMADAGIIISGDARAHVRAPILRVQSTGGAVRRLAAYLRAAMPTPIIAITGSVGKTSSCHLLCHLLGRDDRVTTNGQFNYPDGIVSETCNLGEVEYVVIEASLQGLGEATALIKPHVAVLTQVSPVHVDEAGSLLGLSKQKARLFTDLAPGGTAVINRDITYFDDVLEIARPAAARIVTFGEHADADFRLLGYDASRRRVQACILGRDIEYELGLRGRHMACNSLGVLAAAFAAGVDWEPLLARCATVHAVAGRGALERLEFPSMHVSMIDDTYNASPASMAAAFAMLSATKPAGDGRRIAVLADMLELGDDAATYHRGLATSLIESGVDRVYLTGALMEHLWHELPPSVQAVKTENAGRILRPLMSDLRTGDVLLLKGSHATNMHELAADLRYLAVVRNLQGLGPWAFVLLRNPVRRLGYHAPGGVRRWATWQITKLVQRRQHGVTG